MSTLVALVVAGLALGLAACSASSQGPDEAYCIALTREYVRYVAGANFSTWTQRDPSGDVAVAQCREHRPEPAIPVLEHEFRRAKMPLPKNDPPDRDAATSSP